ncbi:MAG: cytochrome-c peroxidase [Methyloligellaceae bacterium]
MATTAQVSAADGVKVANADIEKLQAKFERPKAIPFPEDNPYSDAKAELGRKLFFDPRLSSSNLISCASCHNPSFGWEDGQSLGSGHKMGKLGRHTPTILTQAKQK